MNPDEFAAMFHVKQSTMRELTEYEGQLRRWNERINLVAPDTLQDVWTRHFADSAQLLQHFPMRVGKLLDIGSGAGFPAIVLKLLLRSRERDTVMTVLESDQRKCAFMTDINHRLNLDITILNQRIESAEPVRPDVITARALAPLSRLLKLTTRHKAPDTRLLLLKGRTTDAELTEASADWHIDFNRFPSSTDPEGQILSISEFHKK